MSSALTTNLELPAGSIGEFCERWKVVELAVFGSVLRADFGPESDVDVLVTFAADARWSLMDWADMTEELRRIFGRDVDLIEKDAVRNPFRRHRINSSAEVLYAA